MNNKEKIIDTLRKTTCEQAFCAFVEKSGKACRLCALTACYYTLTQKIPSDWNTIPLRMIQDQFQEDTGIDIREFIRMTVTSVGSSYTYEANIMNVIINLSDVYHMTFLQIADALEKGSFNEDIHDE